MSLQRFQQLDGTCNGGLCGLWPTAGTSYLMCFCACQLIETTLIAVEYTEGEASASWVFTALQAMS